MINKNHLSLLAGAQCRLLSISRSSFSYELTGDAAMNLDLTLPHGGQPPAAVYFSSIEAEQQVRAVA